MSRLRALTAVLLVVNGLGAAGWLVWVPRGDCATVEKLGRQWAQMTAVINDAADRAADGDEPIGLTDETFAEMESSMSEKLRRAAASVSSPEIARQLSDWADSAALQAEIQRETTPASDPDDPADPWPSEEIMRKLDRGLMLYGEATDALAQHCPGLKAALHTA